MRILRQSRLCYLAATMQNQNPLKDVVIQNVYNSGNNKCFVHIMVALGKLIIGELEFRNMNHHLSDKSFILAYGWQVTNLLTALEIALHTKLKNIATDNVIVVYKNDELKIEARVFANSDPFFVIQKSTTATAIGVVECYNQNDIGKLFQKIADVFLFGLDVDPVLHRTIHKILLLASTNIPKRENFFTTLESILKEAPEQRHETINALVKNIDFSFEGKTSYIAKKIEIHFKDIINFAKLCDFSKTLPLGLTQEQESGQLPANPSGSAETTATTVHSMLVPQSIESGQLLANPSGSAETTATTATTVHSMSVPQSIVSSNQTDMNQPATGAIAKTVHLSEEAGNAGPAIEIAHMQDDKQTQQNSVQMVIKNPLLTTAAFIEVPNGNE